LRCAEARRVAYRDVDESYRVSSTTLKHGVVAGGFKTALLPYRLIFVSDSRPITPAPPWQNGFAERLIGSIRRESVDHRIVLGEAHLRRILKSYARYYDDIRSSLSSLLLERRRLSVDARQHRARCPMNSAGRDN
jgi:hypothetical protein